MVAMRTEQQLLSIKLAITTLAPNGAQSSLAQRVHMQPAEAGTANKDYQEIFKLKGSSKHSSSSRPQLGLRASRPCRSSLASMMTRTRLLHRRSGKSSNSTAGSISRPRTNTALVSRASVLRIRLDASRLQTSQQSVPPSCYHRGPAVP
eukprot:COSAG02_NODE_32575_length_514_cov_0.889157_1_plen_148_part_10